MNKDKSESESDRVEKLKRIVEHTLEQNGDLQKFRAMMRSKVLSILRDSDRTPMTQLVNSRSTQLFKIINQLIMEYFHWMGYNYTMEIFETEATCDPTALSGVKRALNFKSTVNLVLDKQLPVLLSLLKNAIELEGFGKT